MIRLFDWRFVSLTGDVHVWPPGRWPAEVPNDAGPPTGWPRPHWPTFVPDGFGRMVSPAGISPVWPGLPKWATQRCSD